MISTTNNITSFSNDITCEILSYLDVKDLGDARQVCTQWAICVDNKLLWKGLFLRTFSTEPPRNMHPRDAMVQLYRAPTIDAGKELFKKYVSFRCNLEENKKRTFVCFSKNKFKDQQTDSKTIFIITQGVGDRHGTKKGFSNELTDEIEECKIECKIPNGTYDFSIINTGFCNKRISPNEDIESNLNGINVCTNISAHPNIIHSINTLDDEITFQDDVFDEIAIENLDVGWGNTLGYCSNINDWKKPFKFSCVDGKWSGRIPTGASFGRLGECLLLKFVKIGPEGKITYETCENRNYNYLMQIGVGKGPWETNVDSPDVINKGWNQYLEYFPINFPT
jgi:F-box-like